MPFIIRYYKFFSKLIYDIDSSHRKPAWWIASVKNLVFLYERDGYSLFLHTISEFTKVNIKSEEKYCL